jgi:asparagine N-glycosylation enzyme membrane subunit Stt3
MVLRLVPLIVAALLLGAHFLRDGNLGLMVVSVLVPLLLLIKRRWSLIVVQLLAYVGTVIWIQTTIMIVQERLAQGMSWVRVVIILGVVALLTAWAGWLLNSAVVKEKYSV